MEGGDKFYLAHIANCVLNAFFSFTAVAFNIITIHAIRKTSTLPNTLKTLLLSLAVSDLGVGLLVQPLHVARFAMKLKESTNSSAYVITDKVFTTSGSVFGLGSFLGVTALSADRFLAMYLHLRYQELVTHKRVIAAVISVWVFCLFISLARQWPWTPGIIIFVIFVTTFASCLVALAILNYKIFAAVRRHQRQIQTLQVQGIAQNAEMASVGRVRKSAVTSIYIYLVFLLCYLPITLVLVMRDVHKSPLLSVLLMESGRAIAFLNSSLNPLIYCWRMRDIRHNVMGILRNVAGSHN